MSKPNLMQTVLDHPLKCNFFVKFVFLPVSRECNNISIKIEPLAASDMLSSILTTVSFRLLVAALTLSLTPLSTRKPLYAVYLMSLCNTCTWKINFTNWKVSGYPYHNYEMDDLITKSDQHGSIEIRILKWWEHTSFWMVWKYMKQRIY